jgi:hypothetical protein
MESFTVTLDIFDLSLGLIVTAMDSKPFCFRIETTTGGPNSMIINRLPDLTWNAECVTMKYFTQENIQRLGTLIESKNPAMFLKENAV